MLTSLLFISWFLMYTLGLLASFVSAITYLNFIKDKHPVIKSVALSIAWFITFPIYVGCILWGKRQQIQSITEQLRALQQMQAELAIFNQLSSGIEQQGDAFDPAYEQQ